MTAHPPGTIFVLRSSGFVSWSIRVLTRSRVNHAGICLGDGHTVEAEAAGAIVGNERDPGPDITYGAALRDRIEARAGGRGQRIADEAQKLLGRGYNFADIAVLAWGNIRHDPTDGTPDSPNWWQRRVMDDQRLICSQLVDLACANAGVHLFVDNRLPGQVTPGDLEQVLANADWPIVVDP
jgi:hypothetical protein